MAVNAPEPLKAINQYLKQAAILQKHDPVTAYFCRYHAVQEGVTIRSKSCPNDPAVKKFLLEMFDQLDENKKELGSRLDNGAEQVLSTAMKAFNVADNQDRSGNATKQTAITFLAASVFFSVLAQFGQIPQEVLEKQKYAKWKAADIMNAIKQGKKPKPGSKSDQELEAELDSMPQATGGNESSSVGGADNSLPSPSFPTPPSFSSTSPEATSFNPHNLPTLPSHDSLPSPPPSFPSFPTFPQPPTQTSPNNNYGRGEDNLPPPSFSNNDGYAPMDIPAPSFFQKSDSHSNIPAPFFAPPPSYENNGDDDVPSFPSVPHGSPPRSHFTPDFSKYTLPPSLDNPPPSYSPPSYSPPQNLHQPGDEHNRMQQLQQEQLRRQAEEEDRRRRAEEEERNRRMEEHMRQQQQLQQQQILHQQQLQQQQQQFQQQQQQFQQQQQLQQQRMQQQYQQLSPPNPPKANYVPNDDQLELAMKYSKYVTSALQFDDVPTAVKNLKLALKTLTGQEYP